MYVILFNPGAAGDLVSAVIDSKQARITDKGHVLLPNRRATLKRSGCHDTSLYDDFLNRYNSIASEYKSAPSHLYRFHVAQKHNIIFIDYDNIDWLKFTINRLQTFYPNTTEFNHDHLVESFMFTRTYVANGIENSTNKILKISDIFEGRLIDKLSQWIDTTLDEIFYKKWLEFLINNKN